MIILYGELQTIKMIIFGLQQDTAVRANLKEKITQFTEENGFPSNELSDIITDSKGNIWFSSSNKGIIKYNGKNFKYLIQIMV